MPAAASTTAEGPPRGAPENNPVDAKGRRAIRAEPAENGLPEGPERKPGWAEALMDLSGAEGSFSPATQETEK